MSSWIDVDVNRLSFLRPLADLGYSRWQVWLPAGTKPAAMRSACDGTWLLRTNDSKNNLALLWNDFRVKGGSFGRVPSRRIETFLGQCKALGLPLICICNSLGYRFMEGRTIFNDVFNIIPALENYQKSNLVITICNGQCLGLGAVLFGFGHYRIGVRNNTTINLTGPEVFRLFFGKKLDFDHFASVDQQHKKTALIHQRVDSLAQALQAAQPLLKLAHCSPQLPVNPPVPESNKWLDFMARQAQKVDAACESMLNLIGQGHLNLFPGFDSRLRVYVVWTQGQRYGLLMNPPENTNNMLTVRTMRLYQEAIRLFRVLRLPIVSFLDTPGVDPRVDNGNHDSIEYLINANRAIIDYPYPKMGVWIGRGFGGANTMAIPAVYGSYANYTLLDKTTLGVMHESIITHLLAKSKRLMAEWQQSRLTEAEDFSDLVESGVITRAIPMTELPEVIQDFLVNTTTALPQSDLSPKAVTRTHVAPQTKQNKQDKELEAALDV